MTVTRISPQGEYELSIGTDDAGDTFCMVALPDNRTGDSVELVFHLSAFVAFADWVAMIADTLITEGEIPPAKE